MNKKDFYRLLGKIENGKVPDYEEVQELAAFAEHLVDFIEDATDYLDGDCFGTEGWEHAIGWE